MARTASAKGNAPAPPIAVGSMNWGGKALLVFALALLMAVPGLLVFALVADRQHRAETVVSQVSDLQGGSQQVLGPLLVAPYTAPRLQPQADGQTGPVTGWYVVSPAQGQVQVALKGSSLHRGIFHVPVYDAVANIQAKFAPLPTEVNLPPGSTVDWDQARIVLGFTDLRGAR
ncbi:MAG: inner membrane CreD family protein, partial [Caulobacteraceae bacterium]